MQPLTMNTGASFLTPPADGRAARRLMSRVVGFAVVVTLCLIMLGAWVRLTDAGLGCPDWPGCYGHLTPTRAADRINEAVQAQGGEHGPVSMGKAWRSTGKLVASKLALKRPRKRRIHSTLPSLCR